MADMKEKATCNSPLEPEYINHTIATLAHEINNSISNLNLISNARDAMEKAERKKELTIAASLLRHNGWNDVEVIVKDTGNGIPPEDLDKVLNPFVYGDGQANLLRSGCLLIATV
jgi:nitrogen fixation/metabolism regulation signal transduction histidine kinase